MCLGIPGRIVATAGDTGLLMGTADFGGVSREVCLAYVPQAQVGDYVIVHVGFAISLLDEAEAHRTLEVLRSMGDALDAELSPENALNTLGAAPGRVPGESEGTRGGATPGGKMTEEMRGEMLG